MNNKKYILDSIGNTPLIRLDSNLNNTENSIYVKCEFTNPTGSHKDRMYKYGIQKFEKEGLIKKGMTLVDFSSGNAGAALALMASLYGYRSIIVRPSEFCMGKAMQILNYGGEIIEVPSEKGIKGMRQKALEIVEEMNGKAFMMYQTDRSFNSEAFESMANEVISFFNDNGKSIDTFVCPIGTGGTFTALARKIKDKFPNSEIIAVEIEAACVLFNKIYNKNKPINFHNIEGMSVGEIFPNTDISLIDRIEICKSEDAWENRKKLGLKGHFFVGPSSGASYFVSKKVAKEHSKRNNILTIFWDQGWKYFYKKDMEVSK